MMMDTLFEANNFKCEVDEVVVAAKIGLMEIWLEPTLKLKVGSMWAQGKSIQLQINHALTYPAK